MAPVRTVLVTGANTGIGRATATALAGQGDRVYLACRSRQKTQPVLDQIGKGHAEFLQLDLADLTSVRAAAATFLERDEPLHVLINNAGVAGQRGITNDSFELAFGINHLGHFLLTNLLLDRIIASAGPDGPARIINVSSDSHFGAKGIDWDDVCLPTKTVTGMKEYGVSKLANVLHAQELSRRTEAGNAEKLLAGSLHPGVIASDIWRRLPFPVKPVMKLFMKPPEQGARTSV